MATNYDLFLLDTVSSTQTEAQERWTSDPVVVIAGQQSEGRGRTGNRWFSADRSVAVSVTTSTKLPAQDRSVLAPIAGLAAHQILTSAGHEGLSIKWPNDLVDAHDAKVAGILVESDRWTVTVGLGINLWSSVELIDGAGWLFEQDPGPDHVVALGQAWAEAFLEAARQPFDRSGFADRCATVGQAITWNPMGSGMAVDVALDGRLVVDTQAGIVLLSSSEVHHVRKAP